MGSHRKTASAIAAANLDKLMSSTPHLNTQQKLAHRSGVGQTTVGRVRRNELSPNIETLDALAKAFGLTAADLLRDDQDIAPSFATVHSPQVLRVAEALTKLPSRKLSAVEVLLGLEPYQETS